MAASRPTSKVGTSAKTTTTRPKTGAKTTKPGPPSTTVPKAAVVQSLDAATVAAARGEPPARAEAKGQPYPIGVLLAQQGNDPIVAVVASEQLRGAELAVAFLNELGGIGGRPVSLIPVDSGGTPETASAAFQKLADQDAFAVVGPTLSSQVRSLAPLAAARKVLLFGASTSANGVASLNPWVRRVAFPPDVIAANVVRELGTIRPAGTGAVLAPPDDTGAQQLASSYRTALSTNSIRSIPIDVPFTPADISKVAESVNEKGVDLIIPTGPTTLIADLLREFRRAGVRATVVLDPRTVTQSFVEQCKELCDQVLTAVLYDSEDISTLARAALLRRYFDAYGSAPTLAAAQGFSAIQILAIALDGAVNAGPANATLAQRRDGLRVRFAKGEYDTPLGIVRFDEKGEPTVPRIALGELTRSAEVSRIRTIPTVPPPAEPPGVPATEA